MQNDSRARVRSIRQFIGVLISHSTVAIIGCGTFLMPSATDRDTLPSTIIDDDTGLIEDPSDYSILATPSEGSAGAWQFKVTSEGGRPNDELTFVWDFGDGVTLTGPDQAYSFAEPGSHLVTVTAFGRKNAVAFVLTLEVDIPTLNEPPMVDAGEDQTVDANSLVFLYGGGSFDPDDDVLEYLWAQTSGDPVLLQSPTEPTASFIAPSITMDTELGFTLTVSDGELSSQDAVNVYVVALLDPVSQDLIADAGPNQVVIEAETVTLNGTGSSGSGDLPLEYVWYQNAGPTVALSNPTGALTTFQAPAANGSATNLVFELVVTQGDLSASDEVTISVTPDDSGDGGDLPPLPLGCDVDSDCDDGQFCSGVETCVESSCVRGADPCPGQACDEQSDSCAAVPSRLEAAFAETAVVLDGVVAANEWSDAYIYSMDAEDRVPPGAVVEGEATTSSDTSATVRLKHDTDDLLIAVEVRDDNVVPTASDVWAADAVELFIDVDNSDSQGIGLNRFQVLANAGGQSAATDVVPPESWQSASSILSGGYVVEWRIDKSAVGLSDGLMYGFDIAVSDAEPAAGSIATRYWYFSWSAAETDESLWGDLYLEPGVPAPPVLAVGPTSLDFGATAGSMTFQVWNSGGQTLTYNASDNASWMTVSPGSGNSAGERDTLTVTVGRSGLSDGQYSGEITVTPSVGSAVSIAVALTVAQAGGDAPNPMIAASRSLGWAPLAVFFEGTASADVNGKSIGNAGLHGSDIVEYTWRFGDGTTLSGFNAAHVFGLDAGGNLIKDGRSYTVELTVRDKAGRVATASVPITVRSFAGKKIYYVDSTTGNNNNSGLSPTQAWQTYSKAFGSIQSEFVKPGDRVLFRRNRTFTFMGAARIDRAQDVVIGAYGPATEPRPLFQYSGDGSSGERVFLRSYTNESQRRTNGVTLMDVRVNGTSPADATLAFGADTNASNLLLLRTEFDQCRSCIVAYTDGLFLVESTLQTGKSNMFYHGQRLALIDNVIGPAAPEHNLYGSTIERGVMTGNTWRSPTLHNLRIAANHGQSGNIVVSDNEFDGGGNWLSIHLGNSHPGTIYHAENILIEGNRIHGAEHGIGNNSDGYEDITIRNNLIEVASTDRTSDAIWIREFGGAGVGVKGLKVYNNTIVSHVPSTLVKVETSDHQDVHIFNNIFLLTSSSAAARAIQIDDITRMAQITCEYNLFHLPGKGVDAIAFRLGSTDFSATQWLATNPYGQGVNSRAADPLFTGGRHDNYYLSQISAGQALQSPAANAGKPGSQTPPGTTRTDDLPDTFRVDLGYHRPAR